MNDEPIKRQKRSAAKKRIGVKVLLDFDTYTLVLAIARARGWSVSRTIAHGLEALTKPDNAPKETDK